MLKTNNELQELKNEKEKHYGDKYKNYIQHLADCYVSKLNGAEIVKIELCEWDEECKRIIFNDLFNLLVNMRMMDLDKQNFLTEVFD